MEQRLAEALQECLNLLQVAGIVRVSEMEFEEEALALLKEYYDD